MKDEFKLFVKTKPELIKYVNSGELSWQNIYEMWSLYGSDNDIWNKYKDIKEEKKEDSFNVSGITDFIKKIDMDQVKKGVNSLQKIIELLQGFSLKETSNSLPEPRQLFKKFED